MMKRKAFIHKNFVPLCWAMGFLLLTGCQEQMIQETSSQRGEASVSDTHVCSTSASRDQPYSCLAIKSFNNGQWYLDENNTCDFLRIGASTGHVSGTPSNADVGACVASFKVVDVGNGGALSSQRFSLSVLNPNQAPVIAEPTCSNLAAQGEDYSCVMVGSDPDYDDLEWSFYGPYHSCGAFLSIDPNNGEVSGLPGAGDTHCWVSVYASDGEEVSNVVFYALYIFERPVVDSTHCASTTINVNDPWNCDLESTDPNGAGSVIWEFGSTNTCNFLSFDSTTGVVSGTPSASDVGSCVFSVKSFDGDVYSEDEAFTFTVN